MKVLVIGAGHMGSGVAAAAAAAGDSVRLIDRDPERTRAGVAKAEQRAARLSARVPGDVTAATWEECFRDVEVVLEAVAEDRDLKLATLRRAVLATGPGTVVASNTSSLSVADLALASGAAERVVGLHFFSPAHSSSLVEAIGHSSVGDEHMTRAVNWATGLGKIVVEVSDAPGFLVNRVARPLYLEAERFVDSGVEAAAVDAQLRAAGFPIGPLEIVDRTGLDVHATVSRQMYAERGSARFRPVPIVQALVDEGQLGLKSGAGFHHYTDGRRAPDAADAVGHNSKEIGEVARAILAAYVNEAALVVDESYADRETVDLALRLGLQHPVGPFGWIARLGGADEVARIVDELSTRHKTETPIARSLLEGATF